MLLVIQLLFGLFLPASTSKDTWEKYKNDFAKIAQAYQHPDGLSFRVSYCSFPDKSITRADTSISVKYWLKGQKFYYSTGQIAVLKDNSYSININHRSKTIAVNKSADIKMGFLPMQQVDSVLNATHSIINYSEQRGVGEYTIDIKDSLSFYNKMEISFSINTLLVKKVSMYIAPAYYSQVYGDGIKKKQKLNQPRIEYQFDNYELGNVSDNLFAATKYINVSGNKISAAALYSHFKVIDFSTVKW